MNQNIPKYEEQISFSSNKNQLLVISDILKKSVYT